MAIRYRKYQNNNQKSQTYGKWYARAVNLNTITTNDLAEEIAHSTTVTRADVKAVLDEVSVKMAEHLKNSDRVVLDNLGAFKVGIKTTPATTRDEFDATNIAGYRIIFQPEVQFIASGTNEAGNRTGVYNKKLLSGVTAKELPINNMD